MHRRVLDGARKLGPQILVVYEKYPIMMNSIVGGTVYFAGEFAVQVTSPEGMHGVSMKRCTEIGALGSIENGIFMCTWYQILVRLLGAGVSTPIVLFKSFLDQILFATQQDGIFLALCAYQNTSQLQGKQLFFMGDFLFFFDVVNCCISICWCQAAFEDVKTTFLTTWLNDCSVWPLVNFVGFAFVPMSLQPTYMSSVQFFWQIYISSGGVCVVFSKVTPPVTHVTL
jgi:hypothetical protein